MNIWFWSFPFPFLDVKSPLNSSAPLLSSCSLFCSNFYTPNNSWFLLSSRQSCQVKIENIAALNLMHDLEYVQVFLKNSYGEVLKKKCGINLEVQRERERERSISKQTSLKQRRETVYTVHLNFLYLYLSKHRIYKQTHLTDKN